MYTPFHSSAPPLSPTGFGDAGYLSFISQLAEADAADAEFPHIGMGTTADLAAVVRPYLKPLRTLLLID